MSDRRTMKVRAVYSNGSSLNPHPSAKADGGQVLGTLGYAAASPENGMDQLLQPRLMEPHAPRGWSAFASKSLKPGFERVKLTPRDLGYLLKGHVGSTIHDDEQTISFGAHTLKLNLGAGGYVHSWDHASDELLNRGDRWSRGIQPTLGWTELSDHFVAHRPVQGGTKYATGTTPQSGILKSVTSAAATGGGHLITINYIPAEFMPDGTDSVAGVSTDHGGDVDSPILWWGLDAELEIWLDYLGTTDLCRLRHTVTFPSEIESAWFDMFLGTSIYLEGALSAGVHAADLQAATTADLSTEVDATEGRRWLQSGDGKWEDQSAAVVVSPDIGIHGFGAMIGFSGSKAVGLGGRLHVVGSGAGRKELSDYPRGTAISYGTKRAGADGLDGTNFALLGVDSLLTSRFHDNDSTWVIPQGSVSSTCWLAIDTSVANVVTKMQGIPVT